LDYAAVHGHLDVVKVLLLYGATINQDVIKMCADRHPEVARLLRVVTRITITSMHIRTGATTQKMPLEKLNITSSIELHTTQTTLWPV
jgi:ankyrin repeat protein